MLKDRNNFDNNLYNCEVRADAGVTTVGAVRCPATQFARPYRAASSEPISAISCQGVKPEPPEGSVPASTLPFNRGTGTTGVFGSSA
jgi:hypothetical protein